MVCDIQFVAVDVTIADSHDAGIALNLEFEFILCHWYAAAFVVNGFDAKVHQVGAIGSPFAVLRCHSQADSLACRLYLMAGYGFSTVVGDGLIRFSILLSPLTTLSR